MGVTVVELKCAKCGSEKIVPLVAVEDKEDTASGQLRAFIGYANPEAWVFKEPVYAEMRARICGECGFTELFVDNPEAVYSAYIRTKPPHPDAIPGDWKIIVAASQADKAPRRAVYEALRRHHIPHGQASNVANAFHGGMPGELFERDAHRARAIVDELRELGVAAEVIEPPGLPKPADENAARDALPKDGFFDASQH